MRFEPSTALVSNEQGWRIYKSIVIQSTHCLRPGGYLIIERGYRSLNRLKKYSITMIFIGAQNHRDLSDNFRFVSAIKVERRENF